jgi:sugar diacid utilization regulator
MTALSAEPVLEEIARLRRQLDTATRQNRLLRGVAIADGRFTRAVLDGGGLGGVVAVLAELTGKPAAFFDAHLHRVAAAGERDVRLHSSDELGAAVPGSSTALAPRLEDGMRHRRLVAPVDIGARRCGWVVVMEHPARLNAFDELTLRRAAKHLALEVAAARRATSAAWDARSLLARQLIRGTQDDDVRRGAEHLGIELDVPRVVGFVTASGPIDAERLVCALERSAGAVLATKGPEGVALLLELPADEPPLAGVRGLKRVLADACAELGLDPVAALSSVCRGHADVPRGYREAREVARCIDHFSGHRILAADDLGPGRLFVANGDAPAMERFVEDVLGALLTGEHTAAELLRTLQCFFDCGRSIRHSAAELNVHENTVRYRLARVHALTGLDVAADASDQLSVQMSLLVLRLRDHPALPSFEEAA